jgi:hypothetical protein
VPYAIQQNPITLDVIPDPIVANTDAPSSDVDIRQLAALMWIFLEAFEHFNHPAVSLCVETSKIAPEPV